MRRRRKPAHDRFPLPWQLELVCWVIGIASVPFAVWWFINEISSPAETFAEMLGVSIDTQPIIDSARPLIWVFAFIVIVRVRCWLRRMIANRLSELI